jgi:hypothetical protein
MAKRSVSGTSTGSGNGIAGTGVHAFLGTTIHCDAKDTSMYCSFMKIVNVTMIIAFIFFVLFLLYTFLKKKRK